MIRASTLVLCVLAATLAQATPFRLPSSIRQTEEWVDCSSSAGVCINVNTYTCSGTIVTGQCPGGTNILCCTAPGGVPYGSCSSSHNGLCMKTEDCPTTTITGLCPGPSGITCCPGSPSTLPTVTPPSPGTDVPVTRGIYLEDNPPSQTQFRGRRASVRPVIVVHTAESGALSSGTDSRAEGTANFIRTRSDFGSYHILGDTDSIIQLVRFENAAYQDVTGSNDWAVGISLAMNAADWPGLDATTRTRLVRVAAQMAAIAAGWFEGIGVGKPAARQLTKAESDQTTASGFIAHGTRDPTRRSDPGAGFPWAEFFAEYARRVGA